MRNKKVWNKKKNAFNIIENINFEFVVFFVCAVLFMKINIIFQFFFDEKLLSKTDVENCLVYGENCEYFMMIFVVSWMNTFNLWFIILNRIKCVCLCGKHKEALRSI